MEKYGGKVRWKSVAEKCDGKVWRKSVTENRSEYQLELKWKIEIKDENHVERE